MNYRLDLQESVLIIHFEGDLTGAYQAENLLAQVDEIIQQGVLLCVLDMGAVRYLDSIGIGLLTILLTKFRSRGGELIITQPSESLKKLLIVTKLLNIFSIAGDSAEAVVILTKTHAE